MKHSGFISATCQSHTTMQLSFTKQKPYWPSVLCIGCVDRQCHAVASSSLVSSAQIPLFRGSQGSYPQNKILGQARKRQSWSFPGRSLFQWRLKHGGAWFKKEKHMEKYKEHSRRGENYLKKYLTQVSLQNLYVRQW